MIYKKLLITTTMAAVLLSGCGKKQPNPGYAENGVNNVSDVAQIAGETVTINENAYNKDATSGMNANTQNALNTSGSTGANGKYNSSQDGFQSIYFGFGAYGIDGEMQENIAKNVTQLRQTPSRIKIEGNCDEFGTDEYNYALGLKRAKAVKDSIVAQGIASEKMVIISFGESNPVCSNPTDTCYAKNRRVDLRLVK